MHFHARCKGGVILLLPVGVFYHSERLFIGSFSNKIYTSIFHLLSTQTILVSPEQIPQFRIHFSKWVLGFSVCLEIHQVCWSWPLSCAERCQCRYTHTNTHTACKTDYLRQVVEVLYSASRPDCDPVDLVVQAVKQETQKLLSVLLAAGHRNSQSQLEISADVTAFGHIFGLLFQS